MGRIEDAEHALNINVGADWVYLAKRSNLSSAISVICDLLRLESQPVAPPHPLITVLVYRPETWPDVVSRACDPSHVSLPWLQQAAPVLRHALLTDISPCALATHVALVNVARTSDPACQAWMRDFLLHMVTVYRATDAQHAGWIASVCMALAQLPLVSSELYSHVVALCCELQRGAVNIDAMLCVLEHVASQGVPGSDADALGLAWMMNRAPDQQVRRLVALLELHIAARGHAHAALVLPLLLAALRGHTMATQLVASLDGLPEVEVDVKACSPRVHPAVAAAACVQNKDGARALRLWLAHAGWILWF